VGAKEVIPGWDEGLVGMHFMEKRQLIVPAKLGYGEKEQPGIPANSTLIFDVQLIGIARLPGAK
jgi:FK506-binding nuclear protein